MAELIYASNTSLDGCTEDADGNLAWAPPDDAVFDTITELMASMATYLYGRRMYETMAVWETDPTLAAQSDRAARYAQVWQAPEKVVYSATLDAPVTARTRIERSFDPEAVRALKASSAGPVLVGGPHLAASAMAAGLVDEIVLYVWPVIVGGRNPALPQDQRMDLRLVSERVIGAGVVELRYRMTDR